LKRTEIFKQRKTDDAVDREQDDQKMNETMSERDHFRLFVSVIGRRRWWYFRTDRRWLLAGAAAKADWRHCPFGTLQLMYKISDRPEVNPEHW
jgi:hypothetical protein